MILSFEAQSAYVKYSNIKDTEPLDHLVSQLKTHHLPKHESGDTYKEARRANSRACKIFQGQVGNDS